MSFISYAQNFEDIMLWRALGHVSGGFWIDVGAADPDTHSVTRVFSERGWCGVNIEPIRRNGDRLVRMVEEGVAKMFVSFPTGAGRAR